MLEAKLDELWLCLDSPLASNLKNICKFTCFFKQYLELAENQRLIELDHFKTNLYTNITHEFRTPLTIILGMVDQIRNRPKEYLTVGLDMIERNGKNLLNLINQMLDLRKLESGTLKVNWVKDDLLHYMRYITDSFHSYGKIKNIQLHFLTDLPNMIMDYDPDKILIVFSNLVSNAIKFTPEGGNIYISVEKDIMEPDYLKITVKDTGIGISKDNLSHIFDLFYQVDETNIQQVTGTGIGLALTKGLVKLLEGSITVQSTQGKGTTFLVRLPIKQEAVMLTPSERAIVTSKVMALVPDISEEKLIHANETNLVEKPQVLIIEDNPDVVRYLTICLEQRYQIEVSNDGQDGIDRALKIIPDLIICDVMMAKKDGFEVTQILKNDPHTSHIPIILLTAKTDLRSKIGGLERGADAYMSKPFDKTELLVRLKKLLELRQKLRHYYLSVAEGQSLAKLFPKLFDDKKIENAFNSKNPRNDRATYDRLFPSM